MKKTAFHKAFEPSAPCLQDIFPHRANSLSATTRCTPRESKKGSFTAEEVRKLFKCLPHDKAGDSIRLLLTVMRSQELLVPVVSCIDIVAILALIYGAT